LLAWRHNQGQSGRRVLRFAIGANLVALLLAFQFGFVAFTQRAEGQGLEDMRWPVAQVTSQAAIANLPFGSGFGTFAPIYEKFAPRTFLLKYVNHAHNDWLNCGLGGALAIVIAVGFGVVSRLNVQAVESRHQNSILDRALAQAA
jgi:hypothetical protein